MTPSFSPFWKSGPICCPVTLSIHVRSSASFCGSYFWASWRGGRGCSGTSLPVPACTPNPSRDSSPAPTPSPAPAAVTAAARGRSPAATRALRRRGGVWTAPGYLISCNFLVRRKPRFSSTETAEEGGEQSKSSAQPWAPQGGHGAPGDQEPGWGAKKSQGEHLPQHQLPKSPSSGWAQPACMILGEITARPPPALSLAQERGQRRHNAVLPSGTAASSMSLQSLARSHPETSAAFEGEEEELPTRAVGSSPPRGPVSLR